MTGIIICDSCNELFLAHGDVENLPGYLKDIPIFNGVRLIKSTEIKVRVIKTTLIPVFKDYCLKCANDIDWRKIN